MPIVCVWKCPQTGKLFEDKSKYIKHLRSLGIERRIQRQKKVYRNQWDNLVQELNSLSTAQEIADWIESHSKDLLINALNHNTFRTKVPKFINEFKIKVTGFNLKYNPAISCYHSAPRGHRTNWNQNSKHNPTHFPGWTAHLEFGFSHDIPTFFSDVFRNTGIHTGTGSTWTNFEHDGIKYQGLHSYVTLWADDWPGLKVYRALTHEE